MAKSNEKVQDWLWTVLLRTNLSPRSRKPKPLHVHDLHHLDQLHVQDVRLCSALLIPVELLAGSISALDRSVHGAERYRWNLGFSALVLSGCVGGLYARVRDERSRLIQGFEGNRDSSTLTCGVCWAASV